MALASRLFMVKKIKDYLYKGLRFLDNFSNSCVFCSYSLSMGLVCEKCFNQILIPNVAEKQKKIFNLEHTYLFNWSRENKFVEPLIYNLKSGFHSDSVSQLARMLIHQRCIKGGFPQKIHLICSPSFVGTQKSSDHSYVLAQEISKILNCPIYFGLIKNQTQKEKNRIERTQIKINLNKDFKLDRETTYVFIDDVVTTGSTAFQTYLSLGRPSRFEVWSYVYRPL